MTNPHVNDWLKRMYRFLSVIALSLFCLAAQGAPVPLLDSIRCGAGNAAYGIQISDVTGDNGGASECWGAFSGKPPGPSGDGFSIGADTYNFVAKKNIGGSLEGANVGLNVTPSGGAQLGGWSFNQGALGGANFLVVLKAANSPGYAVWLFSGPHAASFSGDWAVAWGHNLSNLSIFQGPTSPGNNVPLPATPALILAGFVGLRLFRKK